MSVPSNFRRHRGTVLVVDDEPAVRGLARRMLESDGYRVWEAADGLQALAVLAERGPVDLVVSDLRMPQMDGRALAAHLAGQQPRTPVLLMSGFDQHPDDVAALGPVLAKPFSAEQLTASVRQLLAIPAQSA
jgi:two-component system cell cycle sensor histidine kinase/response regulator CckA